jgi:hypothetical protein
MKNKLWLTSGLGELANLLVPDGGSEVDQKQKPEQGEGWEMR